MRRLAALLGGFAVAAATWPHPVQSDGFNLEFQRITRPFRVANLFHPKTDFELSAKKYVFRG